MSDKDKSPTPERAEGASPASAHPPEDERREFLKTVCLGGISAGLGAIVAAPAIGFVAYPLTHETVSGGNEFLPAGKLNRFKPGEPTKVELYANKRDAWNRILDVKVGSAWVMREGEQLKVFSTVCPHLGCAIDYDPEAHKFKCPCHHSTFQLDGKVEEGPAPRPLDELEVTKKEDGLVAIRYQRFKQGVSDKEHI